MNFLLAGYCEPFNSFSSFPLGTVYLRTLSVLVKNFPCRRFISINFPTANAFMAAGPVLNKPAYVFRWISEKNTDFMRKFSSFPETCNQLTDTRFHLDILIPLCDSISSDKLHYIWSDCAKTVHSLSFAQHHFKEAFSITDIRKQQ